MLRLESPAPLAALTALAFPGGYASARLLQAVVLQAAGGESAALVDGEGRPVAAFGLFRWGAEGDGRLNVEMWLMVGRAAIPHLTTLRRFCRLALQRLSQDQPVTVWAAVREGHEPGRRLARLVGMRLSAAADGLERWEWRST